MTDPNTMTGDRLSTAKPVMDGLGAHLAEQVGIEAERFSGTVKDGVEAVQEASKTYGNLFMDAYARVIQASMRNNMEVGEHLMALTQVRTVADVFKLNVEFMQRRMSTVQERLFEMIGVRDISVCSDERTTSRATRSQPKIILRGSGQQDRDTM